MNTDTAASSLSLTVNGEIRAMPAGSTLADLVEVMALAGKRFAIEVNGEIVPRGQHGAQILQSGDRVEIVQAIGGG